MAVQIYKPNIDIIRQQAAAAREYEQKRKEDGKFKWGDIVEGDNIIRPLPPTNSRGVLGKKLGKHYFNKTPFQGVIGAQRCLVVTHEDVDGVACPICDMGDRILAQMPQLDIKKWHRAGLNYYIQAVDRTDPTYSKIYRMTPAVYNWLIMQVETLFGEGIDLTDFNQGIDIKITKILKQTKSGERTEYDKTLWNLRGVTPVAEDQNVLNAIVESMINLDDVWKYPSDEDLAAINKAAADIMHHYTKAQYQQPGAVLVVPGVQQQLVPQVVSPQVQPQVVQQQVQQQVAPPQGVHLPQVAQQPVTQPQVVQAQPQVVQPQAAQPQVAQTVVAQPQVVQQVPAQAVPAQAVPAQAVLQQPVAVTPQQVAQQAVAAVQPAAPAQGAPTDRPACFGGAAQREDGGVGYDEEYEQCLMCPHELTCMDASKAAAS